MLKPSKKPSDFKAIRIQLASSQVIRGWSFGEVTKPETINYRSFKPERDGLFCERIFGPVKDWECNCGKYKRIRFRGIVCDRCGVEVTQSKVRRERMGQIELAVSVAHIWFWQAVPSRMGYLLDLSAKELEQVLYYQSYIVIDPGNTSLKYKQLISEEEYLDLEESGKQFEAKMGAEAIRELLSQIDIEELSVSLRAQVKVETSLQRKKDNLKRLRVIEAFRQSKNSPEWMILGVIPVIPPDLRPLVPLEGGRFATSDLNDLYRRVINRNNRLKKLIEIRAPEVILRNEKRMLQEAVDALLDNGRRTSSVRGDSRRPLKSLSDLLKGKQGRFRQNLLGKRVDYSGRSVIVVGPELKLHQCGLPKNMALELFKPFIIQKLEAKGYVQTVKTAKKLVERERPEVWDILEEIIKDHPVLLNRAPTLHRLGIQAFYPVLVEGKAIRLHPLVCAAFNADFDGDQMAVHVPLSFEAQLESRLLMLSVNNLLLPANGRPIAVPSQDMVLGCYYLSKERPKDKGEGKAFCSAEEVIAAHEAGSIGLHAKIRVRLEGHKKLLETTAGRVIFNQIIPTELGYFNELATKDKLEKLVARCYRVLGSLRTALFLDRLKDLGFEYATTSGVTVGIDDIAIPPEKDSMIRSAYKEIDRIRKQYERGLITNGERYNKVIDTWTHTSNEMAEVMFENLREDDRGFNPIFMMADSGARGSKDQIKQLAGMRGLMAKPQKKITGQIGEIIESPITANFREGLTVLEYFISTHGARKGLADTALKTADAGYLTRRLVDVAQDLIITEQDCGTIMGVNISALKEGEEIIQSLQDRLLGRVTLEEVYNPLTDELVVAAGEEIAEEAAHAIEESGIESVLIRSVLTCESRRGVCAKCYGRNLATGKMVTLGEAVGVVAAQSIGEPGTQLTLRTFHIGGTAARIAEQSKVAAKSDGFVSFEDLKTVTNADAEKVVISRNGEIYLKDAEERIRYRYSVPYGATLKVKDGNEVEKETSIFEWDPYTNTIVSEAGGKAQFSDLTENLTFREELDETSGLRQRVIIEQREKTLRPHIHIRGSGGKRIASYPMPTGAHLAVHDGDSIHTGTILAKIPREISKTRDITGGLPRVAELFEARHPKEPAIVSEIDGVVEFGKIVRGAQQLIVHGDQGEVKEYLIPHGKHMRVHGEDRVSAGERLCEGPIDPHDVLKIKGVNAVQEYLLNEIQEVYRLQGVKINDKHIEVIVRQMLQKVRVEDVGDTDFLEGEQVDKIRFQEENERVLAEGGEPATFQPLLLGITKASLSTDSFISAASFQETTRVLTEAAVHGKTDTLLGLKENVIIGRLIPAGTGLEVYRDVEILEEEVPAEAEKELEVIK
ncbi:MAG: DNA-directed RNA polymerase subunit beta' [candidate division Zixibacteria bacterium DG_27]|nr:MAG: DNA-directed RNA polymerase subunit beta' [candidate division Zixibacteria bacterium DG_27]